MNRQQKLVRAFDIAINTYRRNTPGMPDARTRLLRARLVLEEALEFCKAMGVEVCSMVKREEPIYGLDGLNLICDLEPNLPDAIDALCDLNYVSYGSADALGVDLEPFFDLVHLANMQKLNGPIDPNGKQLKPDGWKPPEIEKNLIKISGIHQDWQLKRLIDE